MVLCVQGSCCMLLAPVRASHSICEDLDSVSMEARLREIIRLPLETPFIPSSKPTVLVCLCRDSFTLKSP
jgi:hypothetical protein